MKAGSRLEDIEYPFPAKPLNKYTRSSRQNQSKRQREWVYLSHYLMISGLNPLHIISGQDDGREPDFTLIFYQQRRLYYVGIELTTLPRLREQMGILRSLLNVGIGKAGECWLSSNKNKKNNKSKATVK